MPIFRDNLLLKAAMEARDAIYIGSVLCRRRPVNRHLQRQFALLDIVRSADLIP